MLEKDLSVRTEISLYYDVHIPENLTKPAPLLLAVHGYGAHKSYMMREARLIAPERFVIASLQAPYQHFRPVKDGYKVGFGWLTDFKAADSVALHHKFLLDVIENLTAENIINDRQIFLYGFSQACALNFRFALTHPSLLRGIIGVCGAVPSDLETNEIYRYSHADMFYLYATRDEFYPLEKFREFKEKLKGRANIYTSKEYDAKHEITDEMRADMKNWLHGK